MVRRLLPAPVKQLVRQSAARVQDWIDGDPQLVRVSRDKPLPVPMKLEEAWQRCQAPVANAHYVVSNCVRISGPLDQALLRDCLSYIFGRHEILRSTFVDVGGLRIRQIVGPPEPVPLPLVEIALGADAWTVVDRANKEEKGKIAGLDRGPLMRFLLFRVSNDDHWLLCTYHHFLADRWANRLLQRELALLYEAGKNGTPPPLPKCEPLQYADYACWQRRFCRREGRLFRRTIDYWKRVYADSPIPLELPFVRAAPTSGVDPAEGAFVRPIDKETEERINRLSRSEAISLYVLWLAALTAVLLREIESPSVIINTPMTSRLRHAGLLNMMGDFSNPLSFRLSCDPTKSFRAFVAEVASQVRTVQEYSEIPDVELRNALRHCDIVIPELRVAFEAHTGNLAESLHFADLSLARIDMSGPMQPHFHVNLFRRHGVQVCRASFDPNRHEPEGARAFVERLCRFVGAASLDPDSSISDLAARHSST